MLHAVKDHRLDDLAMIRLILAKWWQDLVLHPVTFGNFWNVPDPTYL